jgi:putative transposase
LRNGARALRAQAVEVEVASFLNELADELTEDGRRRLVRHGHLPEREILTGIGAVTVRCPRVRNRVGEGSECIRFSSAILPPYARRSKSLEVLLPILYLAVCRKVCGVILPECFARPMTALPRFDAAQVAGTLQLTYTESH